MPTDGDHYATEAPTRATRLLGRTGIEVDRVAVGLWGLTEPVYDETVTATQARRVLTHAFARGFRTFDLAPFWGSETEELRSDRVLGEALGANVETTTVIVRIGPFRKGDAVFSAFDPDFLIREVENTLARLGKSRIDVLLLNHPAEKILTGVPIQKGLVFLKAQNMIRAWGIASENIACIEHALELGAEVVSIPHNLVQPDLLHTFSGLVKKRELGVVARSPFAHGLLTRSEVTALPLAHHLQRRLFGEQRAEKIARQNLFLAKAQMRNLAPLEMALRYAFSSLLVNSVIAGPRSLAHIDALTESVGWDVLPRDLLEELDGIGRPDTIPAKKAGPATTAKSE